ncbi:MAG: hypothetical protein GXP62_00010 [Oligoflexia bacterium]|nr:hypothetical protein [Oligoflexia bacterium]
MTVASSNKVVAIVAVALTLAWLWPVLDQMDTAALGSPTVDLPAMLWTLWWGVQPDGASLVNHPFGGGDFYVLAPINLEVARLLAPHTVLAHNVACGLAVALAAVGGGLWGYRLGGANGALIGALGLGTSPPLGAALRDGTGEFAWIGLLAIALWAFDHLSDSLPAEDGPARSVLRELTRILGAGMALAACALSCWYYGLAAGIGAGIVALVRAERRIALPRVLLAGLVGVLLVLPALHSFQASALEPQRQLAQSLVAHVLHGAQGPEPDHAIIAQPLLARTQLIGNSDTRQVGWIMGLGLLSASLLITRWRAQLGLIVAGGVGLILSLGSATPGGLPLPMLWINRALLWFGSPLHLPFHLGALTSCAVVGVAAAAVRDSRALALAGGAALVASLILPGSPLPVPVLIVPRPVCLARLSAEDGAVLDLPGVLWDSQRALDDEALAQLVHGRPIARLPVFPTNLVLHQGVSAVRNTALLRMIAGGAPVDLAARPDLSDIIALGYRFVTLDIRTAPQLAPALSAWLGQPWASCDRFLVYRLEEAAEDLDSSRIPSGPR